MSHPVFNKSPTSPAAALWLLVHDTQAAVHVPWGMMLLCHLFPPVLSCFDCAPPLLSGCFVHLARIRRFFVASWRRRSSFPASDTCSAYLWLVLGRLTTLHCVFSELQYRCVGLLLFVVCYVVCWDFELLVCVCFVNKAIYKWIIWLIQCFIRFLTFLF